MGGYEPTRRDNSIHTADSGENESMTTCARMNLRFNITTAPAVFPRALLALGLLLVDLRAAPPPGPTLLFKSGFDSETRVVSGRLLGPAPNVQHLAGRDGVTGFDWGESLRQAGLVSDAFFQYVIASDAKPETFVTTELRTMSGPHGEPSRVLYLGVKGLDKSRPATTRNEYDLHPTPAWRQAYGRYWMFIHPDLMQKMKPSSWVMVMEWMEPRDPKAASGGTNNWRTNVSFSSTSDKLLAWHFLRQEVQPKRRDEQAIMDVAAPIPVGRWFLLETFWRWGPQGRIWFAIDGHTLFDQFGRFEHATNPLGLEFWALFKNYRHPHFYDADLSNGDETWFAYDDVEIWSDFPAGHPRRNSEPLFVENFDAPMETPWGTLPTGWWIEGEAAGARARIEEGHLLLDATAPESPGATVWLDRELPRETEVSFDVHVIDAVGAANNMNLLFQFHDPKSSVLRENRAERADGKYSRYHSERLTGTILTFLANGNPEEARVRVRHVPPFDPVVQEFRGYHARKAHTYHVQVARRGDRFTCHIDGQKVLDTILPPAAPDASGGYLGFRTWRTKLWWDNVVIRHPTGDQEKPK